MANDFTKNPWIIDTAEDKTDITLLVDYLEWHPNAADDDIRVLDQDGATLFEERSQFAASLHESANIIRSPHLNRWVRALNVETIDGGTLRVYYR